MNKKIFVSLTICLLIAGLVDAQHRSGYDILHPSGGLIRLRPYGIGFINGQQPYRSGYGGGHRPYGGGYGGRGYDSVFQTIGRGYGGIGSIGGVGSWRGYYKRLFFELRPVIDPFQPGIDAEFGGQKPVIGGVRPGIISYIPGIGGVRPGIGGDYGGLRPGIGIITLRIGGKNPCLFREYDKKPGIGIPGFGGQYGERQPGHEVGKPGFRGIKPNINVGRPDKPARQSKLPEFCGNITIKPFFHIKVVNGISSQPGSWPWIATLFTEDWGHFCGATLISDQHVLTAAHCVIDIEEVMESSRLMIRLGEHNIVSKTSDDAEEDYSIIKVTVHPKYNKTTYENDIAILRLDRKVLFNSRITAICLPFDKNISKSLEEEGNSGYIAGWGQLSYKGNKSDILQEAKIFISSQDECRNAFKNFTVKITDEYLCAGTEGSAIDSCEGDSGGPFMQRDPNGYQFYLTGITSFGKKCATPGFPGVYTRVSKFLNWITNNL